MKTWVASLPVIGFGHFHLQAQPCDTGKLDARVATTLKTVLHDLPGAPNMSVEQIRDIGVPALPYPAGDRQTRKVTSDSIGIQSYNPSHATGLPIIIYYHPGGFVTPLLPFMQYECWRQAKAFHAIVVAVDYRIAPEHPFPAAVDDAYHAFCWISLHGETFGGDPSKIIVEGLSAGENLAAVVCQKARLAGFQNRIKLKVLNCPSTDNARNNSRYPSYQRFASGYFLNKTFFLYTMQATRRV